MIAFVCVGVKGAANRFAIKAWSTMGCVVFPKGVGDGVGKLGRLLLILVVVFFEFNVNDIVVRRL